MSTKTISGGTVHALTLDLKKALLASRGALATWEDISPLARNEWICWTVSVKQEKTRKEHIKRAIEELAAGQRRPCCWSGCPHRKDKKMNKTQKWIAAKKK